MEELQAIYIEREFLNIREELKEKACFISSFNSQVFDPYSCVTYHLQQNEKVKMILDRNVLSNLMSIINNKECKTEEQKNALKVLMFAIRNDIIINLTLSIYEYASIGQIEKAKTELVLFRQLDNTCPYHLIEVLNKSKRLEINKDYQVEVPNDFDEKIKSIPRPYDFNYLHLLKIVELSYLNVSKAEKFSQYIDWASKNFCFSGPATVFALLHFSDSKKGGIKNIKSRDSNAIIKNIKNQAWDLSYLHYFAQNIKPEKNENEPTLFCTFDKVLLRIANYIWAPSYSCDALKNTFNECLGKAGNDAFKKYSECSKDRLEIQIKPEQVTQIKLEIEESLKREWQKPFSL